MKKIIGFLCLIPMIYVVLLGLYTVIKVIVEMWSKISFKDFGYGMLILIIFFILYGGITRLAKYGIKLLNK